MPAARTRDIALLLCALLVAPAALATTSCSVTVGQIAFGAYNVFSALPTDTHTTLQLNCTREGGPQHLSISVSIGPGSGGSSTAQRAMRRPGSGELLFYQLFRDASRTAVWGDTPGIDTQTETISVSNWTTLQRSLTVFGRIPAGQDVTPGLYSDTITVNVTP